MPDPVPGFKVVVDELEELAFDADGLLPCVVQEWTTGEVLMLAYMNRKALERTLEFGTTWFYSRSRRRLWNKGETSGNVQHVRELRYDCDGDTLLALVEQTGPACHTGSVTCFTGRSLTRGQSDEETPQGPLFLTLADLYRTIRARRQDAPEGSYTAQLFSGGVQKIGAKVEEEAAEVVEAAAEGDSDHTVYEAGDVLYHLLVLMAEMDLDLSQLWQELEERKQQR